jgi:hypothetical protein
MIKDCNSCFYKDISIGEDPCSGCTVYNKWIAVDVFKNIDNHGENMAARLQYEPKDVAFTDPSDRKQFIGNVIAGGGGIKFDGGKPQWSLLPFKALREVVDVLTYGAKKYAPDNWKKVPNAKQRYIDAGFRHFTAYAGGEKLDSETGKSHLAHAICCLLYLLAFEVGEHND